MLCPRCCASAPGARDRLLPPHAVPGVRGVPHPARGASRSSRGCSARTSSASTRTTTPATSARAAAPARRSGRRTAQSRRRADACGSARLPHRRRRRRLDGARRHRRGRGARARLRAELRDRSIVLGVDRLDYTKGIPRPAAAPSSGCSSASPALARPRHLVQVAVPVARARRRPTPACAARSRRRWAASTARYGTSSGRPSSICTARSAARSSPRSTRRRRRAGDAAARRDEPRGEGVRGDARRRDGVLVLSEFAGAAPRARRGAARQPVRHRGDRGRRSRARSRCRVEEQRARMRAHARAACAVRRGALGRRAARRLAVPGPSTRALRERRLGPADRARLPVRSGRRGGGSSSSTTTGRWCRFAARPPAGLAGRGAPRRCSSGWRRSPAPTSWSSADATRRPWSAWFGALPVALVAEHGATHRDPGGAWERAARGRRRAGRASWTSCRCSPTGCPARSSSGRRRLASRGTGAAPTPIGACPRGRTGRGVAGAAPGRLRSRAARQARSSRCAGPGAHKGAVARRWPRPGGHARVRGRRRRDRRVPLRRAPRWRVVGARRARGVPRGLQRGSALGRPPLTCWRSLSGRGGGAPPVTPDTGLRPASPITPCSLDAHTAAPVSRAGSIDWLCGPLRQPRGVRAAARRQGRRPLRARGPSTPLTSRGGTCRARTCSRPSSRPRTARRRSSTS